MGDLMTIFGGHLPNRNGTLPNRGLLASQKCCCGRKLTSILSLFVLCVTLAQMKGRREKERERKRKGKEEEGKEKGKGEREIACLGGSVVEHQPRLLGFRV